MSVPTATWSTPMTSISRAISSTKSSKVSDETAGGGNGFGVLGAHQAGVVAPPAAEVGVGDHHRRTRLLQHVERRLVGGVGKVDQQADPVHLADQFAPGRGEPAVHRRLGLQVAELVLAIVTNVIDRTPAAWASSRRSGRSSTKSAPSQVTKRAVVPARWAAMMSSAVRTRGSP